MASPQKSKQPPSRWGWMSQAVASVESGLDRILADEEDAKRSAATSKPASVKQQENASSPRPSSDAQRSDSTNRANDRLQARLAQAMAKKNASRSTTPQPPSEAVSRSETPTATDAHEEAVLDNPAEQEKHKQDSIDIAAAPPTDSTENTGMPNLDVLPTLELPDEPASLRPSVDSTTHNAKTFTSNRPSTEDVRQSRSRGSRDADTETALEEDGKLLNVQLEHEKTLASLQEEMNGCLERIDALQRNLQLLTKDAIQKAKEAKNDPDATTTEKKIAEKDEKIAQLIDEGTRLTKGEMQYRNTIKKLRVQATGLNKDQDAVRQRAEKAEKKAALLEARANKAEADAKRASAQISALSKSSSETDAITRERNALQATLSEVRNQLTKANKRAEDAEAQAQSDKLDSERRRVAELQDDLSSSKIERELAEDKLNREIADLKQSLAREKDQARQMETEMLAEQAALESKLESFRLRAEEASSSDHGDSHAKLLRQIETLQSQYSAASQNWQGIESTLLTRITGLEKERDEIADREAEVRRKLRDATSKAKSIGKELEEAQHALNSLQDQHDQARDETQAVTKQQKSYQDELQRLRKEMEDQRAQAEKDTLRRIEEERAKWMASLPQGLGRNDSPAASLRKLPGSSYIDTLMSPTERPMSRRSSAQPFQDFTTSSTRMNSTASVRANGTSPILETPSITLQDDQDDFFGDIPATPASGTRADSAGRLNEVFSASTAAAGPSVQLVERLSTTVRRLESEKAASKDELTRLGSQRDEARQEVVNLMREVEQKRQAADQLTRLEKEHAALSEKYDKTLEMLGERSEQVEELKADIVDVKQMYRQLADTMGR